MQQTLENVQPPRNIYHVADCFCKSNQQPWLFPELNIPIPLENKREAGKRIVEKLHRLRRSLDIGELEFIAQVNGCIDQIRSLTKLTDTQREEVVLYSIEKQGATTFTEIAEDTRLHVSVVKQIVISLKSQGRLRQPRKYIPGSGKPNYITKSVRADTPEAD